MFRVSNKLKTFFVNSSLVTIQGKLDIVTASFWSNLRHIYSQISQLWVSTKGLGGWPTSDFVSLQFINTLPSSQSSLKAFGQIFGWQFSSQISSQSTTSTSSFHTLRCLTGAASVWLHQSSVYKVTTLAWHSASHGHRDRSSLPLTL